MNNTIKLAVHGAAGRMGQRVVALASGADTVDDTSGFTVVGAIDHSSHPKIGQDAGVVAGVRSLDVPVSADWPEKAEVVIDFSLPEAFDACVARCVSAACPLVVATTGLSDQQKESLAEAAQTIPIVWAPSMSLAVNLSMRMAQQITKALRDVAGGVDIEILERHHRFKADAPSGTALKFGELIADAMNADDPVKHVHGREGHTGQRSRNEIGYHAIRVGDNPGEHTIVFGMLGEKIELNVAASNRDCYASGALAAAKWLMRGNDGGPMPAGLYNMFDVLGMADADA
ncbi:4-hydroxy-tetrahydrodipicolinate reductase [Aporhodopirellula aestuarii]|uniref:4-hydroxy-tetrahydrodipicolinate reductase n=1 Tax=Aporhodopirellula aestuarii TaxID=2950107 RepID=A0ABT0U471_9BACT|nr:4-hydroxy-tetrahydrodipicolinate reductase [Aporhodopirellula aestuarii]MCM2371714.1 4-hydroxy-tetrahydrodipicolinate reductase [Aporhodopirellula aestuarii]